jgi:PEGA domain
MHRLTPFLYTVLAYTIAAVSLIGSGCASHTHTANVRQRQKVLIVSQPPGAKIEVNGRYVGDAPTTVEIESSNDGRFWRDTIIRAYPADTGYTQILAFNGKSHWAFSDLVPPRIVFDTRSAPGAGIPGNQ